MGRRSMLTVARLKLHPAGFDDVIVDAKDSNIVVFTIAELKVFVASMVLAL